ncbi:hypothetical protein MA16_Dca022967 [Dendrobium catenatum]|uniref:Uncharacterized protein n=1 Tax=Dendrobium catenatum TaxID=906689 RepID=A0A2I0VCA6_9ASPA|nr:hypothetical protein MA16_Dca022967 [Dendrobium catenatum]
MVQNSWFRKTPIDDSYLHLDNFLQICATFKYNGVNYDVIRLRLFLFSPKGKAKMLLNSLPSSSIIT